MTMVRAKMTMTNVMKAKTTMTTLSRRSPSKVDTRSNGIKNDAREQAINEVSLAAAQEPFSFSTKRLCEGWLDNLFMVLYEVYHSQPIHLRVSINVFFVPNSRIYAFGPYSVPRSLISRLSTLPIAKLG